VSAPPRDDRRIIPRWRSFTASLARGELDPLVTGRAKPSADDQEALARRAADFDRDGGRVYASDFVASALVLGPSSAALAAARRLSEGHLAATPMTRRVADLLVREGEGDVLRPGTEVVDQDHAERKRTLRLGLRANPRNALRWADVARLYTIDGRPREASRAMKVALALSPENRYVIRSAVRLRLHAREPDAALAILSRNSGTRRDPWLLAAEIAVADLAHQRSRNVRRAQAMLDAGQFSDFELSELASALGTLELDAGDHRQARKLFRRALVAPTDNSVAQAEWAAPRLGLEVGEEPLAERTSWEARALVAQRAGDPKSASDEAWGWLDDQPFASRPAEFGSYAASSHRDFERGFEFARRGIVANPDEFLLRNNAAFCLLSMNRVQEAEHHLAAIRRDDLKAQDRAILTATLGLYHYRRGDPEAGRKLYQDAIRMAREPSVRTLATIMLAREELLAGGSEAAQLAARARQLVDQPTVRTLKVWLIQLTPQDKQ
jgi:tetratricopeptide (TPR) repeat protein